MLFDTICKENLS